MHDLKSLRKNLEEYKNKLLKRNFNLDTEEFTKIDKFNRELINQKELLEQEKKKLSKSKDDNNFDKSKVISVKINEITEKQKKVQTKIDLIVSNIPNIALDDVPTGKDEKDNKIIKKFGDIK